MIFVGMTQSELIQHLYDEISRQNTMYIGIIGLLVAAFAYFQWRMSDKKVRELENKISDVQEIASKMKKSNESLIQYSLNEMSVEGLPGAVVAWHKKAAIYISSKQMADSYYSDNNELSQDLKKAKFAVLMAFRDLMESIVEDELGDYYGKPLYVKCEKLFTAKKYDFPYDYWYVDSFNYSGLKELGSKFTHNEYQSRWFTELEKFNKFWNDETLE